MPTINENKSWNTYEWDKDGDEWSEPWGNTEKQWYKLILPMINSCVPANTILEIAPGHGRCTSYLKDLAQKLIIVDLNSNCIDYCKRIFKKSTNIEYHTNNGRNLSMIDDKSVDFVFSWDSFVHIDLDDINEYIKEFSRILKDDAVGFIHHSNMAEYSEEVENTNWRSNNVSYQNFKNICEHNGLKVLNQELVNWKTENVLSDCFTLFIKTNIEQPYNIKKNFSFMKQAEDIKRITDDEIKKMAGYKKIKMPSLRIFLTKILYRFRLQTSMLIGKIGIVIRKISPKLYLKIKKYLK